MTIKADRFVGVNKTTPTPQDDVKPIRDALADYSKWAGRPTVLENALAHIDAQAVRLEDAERYQWTLHHLGLIEAHAAKWSPAKHRPLLVYIQDFIDNQRAAIASEAKT